jgi:hypothetical protein
VRLGFTGDPIAAYTTLTGNLQQAVSSGDFSSTLQSYAIAANLTGLRNATSSSVVTAQFEEVSTDDGEDTPVDNNNKGTGASTALIIGVVVGVIGSVLILLCVYLYFYCGNNRMVVVSIQGQSVEKEVQRPESCSAVQLVSETGNDGVMHL